MIGTFHQLSRLLHSMYNAICVKSLSLQARGHGMPQTMTVGLSIWFKITSYVIVNTFRLKCLNHWLVLLLVEMESTLITSKIPVVSDYNFKTVGKPCLSTPV